MHHESVILTVGLDVPTPTVPPNPFKLLMQLISASQITVNMCFWDGPVCCAVGTTQAYTEQDFKALQQYILNTTAVQTDAHTLQRAS